MNNLKLIVMTASALALCPTPAAAQANVRIDAVSMMHESRATVSPKDGSRTADRFVSLQWPLPEEFRQLGAPLDGFEKEHATPDKTKLRYKVRFGRSADLSAGAETHETLWPLYNAHEITAPGKWYWQYACTDADGRDDWSPVYSFTVEESAGRYAPPSFGEFIAKLPAGHPRILTDDAQRDALLKTSEGRQEREWYIEDAEKALAKPMLTLDNIPTEHLATLTNKMQVNSFLTRESRKVIDAEERNIELLTRAYVLTGKQAYADEALKRVLTMTEWSENPHVKGDFNDATLLSVSTLAYDTFHHMLTPAQKQTLLTTIGEKLGHMYDHYNNYLENHIAENHIWQMTLRIATYAALATYGELPESELYAKYLYNVWLARFPGLNADGAWHNGDSYYTVNTRTLVELTYTMGRIAGFNYFSDPWYSRNVLYAIYQQPPFSKSGGNGSSHLKVKRPLPVRVGQLDALARIIGDTYAADYVRITQAKEPQILKRTLGAKAGDLTWTRLQLAADLPEGKGLADLPAGHVFAQSGLASFNTSLADTRHNAMWSFRSSPYGSTSHALANQNAFNTFYGGDPLFYSSGHHIEFTDLHSMLCHRGTRAHNTILVDGMGQRIGVEGYGWIPRSYSGATIGYVAGDASNAYGKVISPLWLDRGRLSDVDYSPENGWDENHLVKYRRHMVNLGNDGLLLIYDELEADRPVEWSYLLHTVENPMHLSAGKKRVHVTATNSFGASDAWLYASGKLATDTTSQFFKPAVNWLVREADGTFKPYPNHWHFTARSGKSRCYRFATLIDTHDGSVAARVPVDVKGGKLRFGDWTVSVSLDPKAVAAFSAEHIDGARIEYRGEETRIIENGKETVLTDEVPELEI